jgi:predicted dehydrogenase
VKTGQGGMSLSRPSKLRAAVVGLGKAGSRFDEEPRGAVWSHVGAYLAANDIYELAGAADPDAESRAAFSRRCPGVPCYTSAAEMCSAIRPDVVSIATPINVREQVFDDLLQGAAAPQAIICEKPLATNGHTRWQCVERCRSKGVPLLVHYNRRYASVYQRICTSIREGLIGDVTSITVRMANRLWSVGSHALDLLLYLAAEQPCTWRGLELPHLAQGGEPAIDFICCFPSGTAGRVLNQGLKQLMIFEADVVGTKGRLLASGNGEMLHYIPFAPSPKYLDYLIGLSPQCLHATPTDESTFVAVVREAAEVLGSGKQPTCSGETALRSEEFLDELSKCGSKHD